MLQQLGVARATMAWRSRRAEAKASCYMVYDPTLRSQETVHEADYRVLEDGQIARPARKPGRLRRYLGPAGAAALFAITKLKAVLLVLKSVTFFSTGASALLSIGAYALFFGWQFAVGLVVLLFIHEMGHALVLKHYGVPASAPIFIPFMGAIIGMKQLPKNAVMEAYVGLGGPVIGSLGAMAAWGIYQVTNNTLFLVMAYVGVLLNLFNLLPVLPLDGGRAVAAISRWIWVAGFVGLVGLLFLRPSPILAIVLLFGGSELWSRFRGREHDDDYYTVPAGERLAISLIYFGLMAVLAFSLYELEAITHIMRPQ